MRRTAGSVWSSLVEDGQNGWFDPGGWQWVITHERASWGRARGFEEAKVAVAAQLGRTQEQLPRCEIRPLMENEAAGSQRPSEFFTDD